MNDKKSIFWARGKKINMSFEIIVFLYFIIMVLNKALVWKKFYIHHINKKNKKMFFLSPPQKKS